MAAKATVKSLAKKLTNAGERSKLPDSALSPVQLKERKRLARQAADPIGYAVGKLATAQFAPQERQAKQDIANTGTQFDKLQSNAKAYQGNVAAGDTEALARQKTIGEALRAAQTRIAGDSATDIANLDHADVNSNAQRGGGLSTMGDPAAVSALAKRASTQLGAQDTLGEQQVANFDSLANAAAQARAMHGDETQERLGIQRANQLQGQQGALGDLAAKKAAFVASTTLDQQDKAVTNELAAKALKVKLTGIKSTADTAAATRKLGYTRIRHEDERARASAERAAAAKSAASDDKFLLKVGMDRATFLALPTAKRAKLLKANGKKTSLKGDFSTISDATALIHTGLSTKAQTQYDPLTNTTTTITPSRPLGDAETKRLLLGRKVPDWAVEAAMSIKHHGYILPAIQAQIQREAPGVSIPSKYLPPKK